MERLATKSQIEFIANVGQLHDKHRHPIPDVLFSTEYQGLTTYFEHSKIHFFFTKRLGGRGILGSSDRETTPPQSTPRLPNILGETAITYRLDLAFDGANPNAIVTGGSALSSSVSYYTVGLSKGATDLPVYGELIYHDLYPNIDMRVYTKEGGMKTDFIVRPGGDPKLIRMRYEGADSLQRNSDNITIYIPLGTIKESNPVSFQEAKPGMSDPASADLRHAVVSSYRIASSNGDHAYEIGFDVGAYDATKTLTIDPPRVWATYYGGSSYDALFGVCTDRSDNIYAVGVSYSAGLGTAGVHQDTINHASGYYEDGLITKFSPAGNRIWTTYYGGGLTYCYRVALDRAQNVIVIGETYDDSCIASPGAFQTIHTDTAGTFGVDGFIAKFDPLGHRLWGTFYGTQAYDVLYAVAIDSSDNIIVGGYTTSTSGLGTAGAYKLTRTTSAYADLGGFIAKFSPTGNRYWGSYFGDTTSYVLGIAIAQPDTITFCGETYTHQRISTPGSWLEHPVGYYAGYIERFSTIGAQIWGTYVDGNVVSNYTGCWNIACAPRGRIITTGITSSQSGLATAGAYRSTFSFGYATFLEIFEGSGSSRVFGTYYANSNREFPADLAATPDGGALFVGWTADSTHIATSSAYQSVNNDTLVGFASKFSRDGALQWGTYYSGNGHPDGTTIVYGAATDHHGHAIFCGPTGSNTGISTPGSYQSTYGGSPGNSYEGDGFLVKMCDTLRLLLRDSYKTEVKISPLYDTICAGENDTLSVDPRSSVTGTGFLYPGFSTYQWRRNGAIIPGANTPSYVIPLASAAGSSIYTLDIADPNICAYRTDTIGITVRAQPVINAGPDQTICQFDSVRIGGSASGAVPPYTYRWSPTAGLSDSTASTTSAAPRTTTSYILTTTDANGCQARDTVVVNVLNAPIVQTPKSILLCRGSNITIGTPARGARAPYTYNWQPATGLSATDIAQPLAQPNITTEYHLTVTDANGCTTRDTITVTVDTFSNRSLSPGGVRRICLGDSIEISAPAGVAAYLWSNGQQTQTIRVAQQGSYSALLTNNAGCTIQSDTTSVLVTSVAIGAVSGPTAVCSNAIERYTALDTGNRYTWSLPDGGSIRGRNDSSSVTILWSKLGTWSITLHARNATCTRDTTLIVVVGSSIVPEVTPAGPLTLCGGDRAVLTAPAGYASYRWSNGDPNQMVVVGPGTYTVTVTSASGCSGTSKPVVVDSSTAPKPTPRLVAAPTVICRGDSVALGTTQSYSSYFWSTGDTTSSIVAKIAGGYWVAVTNSAGCRGISDTLQLSVLTRPSVVLSSQAAFGCDSVKLSASASGQGILHYSWSDGTNALADTTSNIQATHSGLYRVVVSNEAGCSAKSNGVPVSVMPSPHPTIAGPSSVCIGELDTYRSSDSLGFTTWSLIPSSIGSVVGSSALDSVQIQWASSATNGTLRLSVDHGGCVGTKDMPITVGTSLKPTITAAGPLQFCNGDSVTLYAGSGYATYQWTNNASIIASQTTDSLNVHLTGKYAVMVSSVSGCKGTSDSISVTQFSPVKPTITLVGQQLVASNARTFQWSLNGAAVTGATQQAFKPAQSGRITVTVTDANGCMGTSDTFFYNNRLHVTLTIPQLARANPGDTMSVPIIVTDASGLAASGATHYEIRIRFNASLLANGDASRLPAGVTRSNRVSGADRVMTVIGSLPSPLPATPFTLLSLPFVAALGNDTCTGLSIDTSIWRDSTLSAIPTDAIYTNSAFCLTGVCMAGGSARLIDASQSISLSNPVPNPSSDQIEVNIHLSGEAETHLYLEDVMGRRVREILNENISSGDHKISIRLTGIATGSYRLVLQSTTAANGATVITKRVEVLH